MKKRYIDRLSKTDSTQEEEDEVLRTLMKAHLDDENRAKWSEQLQQQGIARRLPARRMWWKAAAAAVFLLLAGTAVWLWQKSQTPAALAYGYIREDEPFQLPSGSRGNEKEDSRTISAIQAYNAKDYKKAIQLLRDVVPASSTLQRDLFLKGMCFLYAGDYAQAIPLLIRAKNAGGAFDIQADWFLALAYLRSGDPAKATPLLRQLAADPGSGYAERADQLLQAMPD